LLLKQLRAFLLPVTVTLIIPTLLTNRVNLFWGLESPLDYLLALTGSALILSGLFLVVVTVRLFILIGQGTLAPWDPTRRLVVVGVYRYVRNPMISGVFCILLGETVLLGSTALLLWTLFFVIVNLIYIPLIEEPGLIERFGDEYRDYVRHVPRWLPRRTPWSPTTQ
jgi:protein-S-isoprenylcysteine O-methyltransferase Ste14